MAGARASVGDLVFTKHNDRTLALGATDFVRNGYRWEVTEVDPDGSITVTHLESNAHLRLPAAYVRSHVTLGYARTIDATQGATARYRCHTVGSDQLTRQQVYTALTRGCTATTSTSPPPSTTRTGCCPRKPPTPTPPWTS